MLDNVDYEEKVQHQINRSSFEKIAENPNKTYEKRVNTWIEKWYSNKSISEKWKKFITVKDSTPGKMYGNVKTHKIGNPTRVITSGCNSAMCFMILQVNCHQELKIQTTCWTLLTT